MKFKEVVNEDDVVCSDDLYYDLFDGGSIDPHKMLVSEDQANEVERCMEIIKIFLREAEHNGNLEVM